MLRIFRFECCGLLATALAGGLLCTTLVSSDMQFGVYSASNASANSGTGSDVPGTSASGDDSGDSKSGTTDVGNNSGAGAEWN
jgi:hypothetical protein